MKFQKGDMVLIGYTPESYRDTKNGLGCVGEIVGFVGYFDLIDIGEHPVWEVSVDGELYEGAEYLLEKVPPEEHGRTKEKEEQKPVEAV